jgi:hypothetical protein
MKKILSEILNELRIISAELKSQSEMLDCYHMKSNDGTDMAQDHIKSIQKMMLNHPLVQADPYAKDLLKSMFEKGGV